jgi:hypothetical protein
MIATSRAACRRLCWAAPEPVLTRTTSFAIYSAARERYEDAVLLSRAGH